MAAEHETITGSTFWEHSTDTHKAPESYYDLVDARIRSLVTPRLSGQERCLDFGCGNGEFTRLLASNCAATLAVDVSESLIATARSEDPCSDSTYVVGTSPPTSDQFDLVSCMGVLVCVLEDTQFQELVHGLARCVAPGGTLLLRETLSWGAPQTVELAEYTARYRTPLDYLQPLAQDGIQLVHDEHLVTWSETDARSNHLWVLERPLAA